MSAGKSSGIDLTAAKAAPGGPLLIDVNLIDEDPQQPRGQDNPGFRPESIAELAASYGPRGPKTPLSLRENPDAPGRYIINHGHRRFRAGKVRGLSHLPAFVDNEYDDADQVIENLQRENMTPREVADYIGRELAKGKKKGEIAERIGKSRSFVSQHVTLLDLPEPIAAAFNSGRVNDVTLVNELVTAYKLNPGEVTNWLTSPSQEVSRGEVKLLREYLSEKLSDASAADGLGVDGGAAAQRGHSSDALPLPRQRLSMQKPRTAVIQVEHAGRNACLVLDRRPSSTGHAWLRYDDGQHSEAELADVRLVAIIEGN
jgi:ParB family chromosome partitioning protein